MVSALPQRSDNSHHVSMIENYPATLEVLGEPIRQVGGVTLAFLVSTDVEDIVNMCFHFSPPFWKPGALPSVGRCSGNSDIL